MKEFLASFLPTLAEVKVALVGGSFGVAYAYLFGAVHEAFLWLLGFMLTDFLTGHIAACKRGEWKSSIGLQGTLKKILLLWIVALSRGLDVICGTHFLQSAVVMSIALTEFGSIIENLCRMGFTDIIPENVQRFLAEMKHRPLTKQNGGQQ